MTILKKNILITTIVVLTCIASLINAHKNRDDGFKECKCVTKNNKTMCRYANEDGPYPDKSCASDPHCETDDDYCLPLLGKHPPMECNFSLCKAPVVGGLLTPFLHKLKTSHLIVTIIWNHLKCKGKPTKISVKIEDCMVYIKIEHIDTSVNCLLIILCRSGLSSLNLLGKPQKDKPKDGTEVTPPSTRATRGKHRKGEKSCSSGCSSCSAEGL